MDSYIKKAKNKTELYKAPRLYYEYLNKKPYSKDIRVGIIATPCHGFGDVVFATKFAEYMTEYSNNVEIITPAPEMFKKIGISEGIKLITLGDGTRRQCRRIKSYKRPRTRRYDLFFIAPLQQDFDIDYSDIKSVFKESNPFNTIFLSEYQDLLSKKFDLPTGVGNKRYGMLFTDPVVSQVPNDFELKDYILAYFSQDVGNKKCFENFLKMVVEKYKNKKNLQIIIPKMALPVFQNKNIQKYILERFSNLNIIEDKKEIGNGLTIRADIFPVDRNTMLSLMKYSLPDILVTGDQSMTDVVDLKTRKTIWYQTVPWKINFAKALSKALPQPYLESGKSSCGSIKYIDYDYDGNLEKFKRDNDFRILAKDRLNAIFYSIEKYNEKSELYRYIKLLEKPGRVSKEKLIEIF